MILVDSSIWIRHFRHPDPRLQALVEYQLLLLHPFVLGELACGKLSQRPATIAYLRRLARASIVPEESLHQLLNSRRLWDKGLGWIDLHLLASVLVDHSRLWTADAALSAAARTCGVEYPPL